VLYRFYFCKGKGHPKTCLCRHRREAEVKLLPICNLAIEGDGDQHHALASLSQGRPGTDLQQAGWASWVCLDGNENLALTGIRSPYCHVRSDSLYRLSYSGRRSIIVTRLKIVLKYVLASGQQTNTQQFHSVCRLVSHARSDNTKPFLGRVLVLAPNPTKAAQSRAVFLNRRAAARYWALTSIIPGRENLSF
jgi:hypothetical protein